MAQLSQYRFLLTPDFPVYADMKLCQHKLRYKIAHHKERNLDPSGKPVLHSHVYGISGKGKWHSETRKATKAMRKRYGSYFGRSCT